MFVLFRGHVVRSAYVGLSVGGLVHDLAEAEHAVDDEKEGVPQSNQTVHRREVKVEIFTDVIHH